jgi:hypothetical protein
MKQEKECFSTSGCIREDYEKYDFDKNNKHEKSNEEFAEDDQR